MALSDFVSPRLDWLFTLKTVYSKVREEPAGRLFQYSRWRYEGSANGRVGGSGEEELGFRCILREGAKEKFRMT